MNKNGLETFIITVEETLSRQVEVKAVSYKDAVNKVKGMYQKEEIVLDSSDFNNVEFN